MPAKGDTKLSEPLIEAIVARMLAGETLRSIVSGPDAPVSMSHLMRWQASHEWVRDRLVQAREMQSHLLVDEAVEKARAARDKDSASAARAFAQVALWVAERVNRQTYGARLEITAEKGLLSRLEEADRRLRETAPKLRLVANQ